MLLSWPMFWGDCKSSLSAISRALFQSRQRLRTKVAKLRRQQQGSEAEQQRQAVELERARADAERQAARIAELQEALNRERTERAAVTLPPDPPLRRHQYGPRMISLCVNLARRIGFRSTVAVLKTFFKWLGISSKVPTWQAIRGWMQRVGVARMKEKNRPSTDCVWLVDHSNQIGPEKAFVALAVRASKLPPKGQTLKQKDVRLLTVLPGTAWKTEDMKKTYQMLAAQHGTPRAILADGACELREGVQCLKKGDSGPLVLRDFKHFLANRLESVVGKNLRFGEFIQTVTHIRAAVQQTELAHFSPPRLKQKARFMNLKALLNWAEMMLWQLDHAESKARKDVSPERMKSKFGALRLFSDQTPDWWACQNVVSAGVKFINENGIDRAAADDFRRLAEPLATTAGSRRLLDAAVEFLTTQAASLKKGERLPLSTELLESTFALYKQLERQHSQGGFTQLLSTFGALLRSTTPSSIRRDFQRIKVRDVQLWTKTHMPSTLNAQRQTAYHEFRKAKKQINQKCATKATISS